MKKIFTYSQWKEIRELSKIIIKSGHSPDINIQNLIDMNDDGVKMDLEWEITEYIMSVTNPRESDNPQLTFNF